MNSHRPSLRRPVSAPRTGGCLHRPCPSPLSGEHGSEQRLLPPCLAWSRRHVRKKRGYPSFMEEQHGSGSNPALP